MNIFSPIERTMDVVNAALCLLLGEEVEYNSFIGASKLASLEEGVMQLSRMNLLTHLTQNQAAIYQPA